MDDPTLRGLGDAEAAARRARGLGNDYRPPTSRGWWEILRENAYLGVNGPLAFISLLLLLASRPIDALFTAGPVFMNILIGVVQEARAKRQLDGIALLHRPRTVVVRDGVAREVDPAELVLGDIVELRRGDEVAVDGRLAAGAVELDESILTGEAEPVGRGVGAAIASGSVVISGGGLLEVERVGAETLTNRLLAEARGIRADATPLQREIAGTIRAVALLVLATAGVVALAAIPAGGLRGQATLEAAAVLVTLVPQGLAIMVTVTYAAGALRVTRLGALVQRRSAIESMSRVDTLCLDKTGTLTTPRVVFAGAEPAGAVLDAGTGAEADGHEALLGAIAASSASPNRTTDALRAALPAPVRPVADEVPFSSERRWSALRFEDDGSVGVLGAPATLLAAGEGGGPGSPERAVLERAAALAARGRRVLLLARGRDGSPLRDPDGTPLLPAPLAPLALLVFEEELRPDARETLAGFADAGVELKVISGDDPTTVAAIGRAVGLTVDGQALAGPQLDALDDAALGEAALAGTVFGRVDPTLKARLVAALRARGRYVAMIGDGVNDLLPLRRAHLGVAMASGSPATRGAADLVLLDDAFAVLPTAVVEGQRILAAMQATLVILLARTFYVLLIVLGTSLVALPFPFTPRQNSGLAFVTVGVPLIVLALWVPPRRSPRRLVLETLGLSLPASAAVALVALPVYASAVAAGAPLDVARTILTTMTVLCGLGLLPLVHPVGPDPHLSPRARRWPWILAALMALLYVAILAVPVARDLYELVSLDPPTLGALGALGLAWTAGVHLVRRTGVVGRIETRILAGLEGLAARLRRA